MLGPGAKFCQACGVPAAGSGAATSPSSAAPSGRLPWIVAGVLAIVAISAVVYATRPPATPLGSGNAVAPGTPPDLSTMTPKEQFDRLNDRVTRAAEQGDSTTAVTFWPMAATAYANLPPGDRDIDSRFHMAWLHYLVGEFPATLALADTIMTESPGNLFGYYLRAAAAKAKGDSAEANRQRDAYKAHFDAEIKRTDRQEYVDHRTMLDQYFKAP